MPRPDKLRYTYCSVKQLKSGRTEYWRFRHAGTDTPLPGDPRTHPDAMRRYAELIEQVERLAAREEGPPRHSFDWLARHYLASSEFAALALDTQRDYRRVIEERLLPVLGPERFDCLGRAAIKLVRDSVTAEGKAARTANKVKQVASLLYSWAEEEDLLPAGFANPGMRLKSLRGKTTPFEVWSREEIALFLAAMRARGDGRMVTAVLLALYTGQRAGDLVAMQWSDCLGGTIRVRQNKTGEPLTIPCHPVLRQHLEENRTRFGGTILRGADGRRDNANALASAMNRAINAVEGMPARSLHGLRYAAAAELEAIGCGVVEITSIVGHRTYQMAMKYASQRRHAEAAIARLGSGD